MQQPQQQEVYSVAMRELMSPQIRRSIFLTRRDLRLKVDPDASIGSLYSGRAGRLVFGRGSLEVFKVQSGLKIPLRQRELRIKVNPTNIVFDSKQNDPIAISQTVSILSGESQGFTHRLRTTNRTESPLKVRIVTMHDPTSINFRRERDAPGEIGVNAFNRGDHVVMDDVGDTSGVRVIAFTPRPSAIFMTKDRQRSVELQSSGEIPESTAGMSGAILVLTQHEFELAPLGSADVSAIGLYHESSLEAALSDLALRRNEIQQVGRDNNRRSMAFRSSSTPLNFAFNWAQTAMDAIELEDDRLDRLWSGLGLLLTRPDQVQNEFERARTFQRRDGFIEHSVSSSEAGLLETCFFLISFCTYLRLRGEKKLARKWLPHLKKAGDAVERKMAETGLIDAGSSLVQGWRRRLGAGYPTGVTSEINLVAIRALKELASLLFMLGKGSESARFGDSGVRMMTALNERLRDAETATLSLNLDVKGRLHKELTIDQVIGLSYSSPDHNLSSATVHRLLDKDFECGFGLRSVPSSNALYYNPTYGDGQLGGCWTRGTLAHAALAYQAGYPNIGSMQLEKVARIVHSEAEKLGGVPGEFPYWIDSEKRIVGSLGSDPVAASRFIEAVLFGEAGLALTALGAAFRTPQASQLKWFVLRGFDLGEKGSLFVGRAPGKQYLASTFKQKPDDSAVMFPQSEQLESSVPTLEAIAFWDQTQVLMAVGNTANTPTNGSVSISLKGKPLSASLFVDRAEFTPEVWTWTSPDKFKVADKLETRVELKPASWKLVRFDVLRSH